MQTKEFQEELEAVRKNEEERLAHQKKQNEAAEVRRQRSCMERPKIDYVPERLYIDLEDVYAKYFQQEVTFFPKDKDDFMYMLRHYKKRIAILDYFDYLITLCEELSWDI